MKTIVLSILLLHFSPFNILNAQFSFVEIPIEKTRYAGRPIVFDGELYFQCAKIISAPGTYEYQFAKYNGSSVSLIENPNNEINTSTLLNPFIFHDSLFIYFNNINSSQYKLAKLKDNKLEYIPGLDMDLLGKPFVFNENLYCFNDSILFEYDGIKPNLIPRPLSTGSYYMPFVFNNIIHFIYRTNFRKLQLGYYNENTSYLFQNPDKGFGFDRDWKVEYNNKLYLRYLNELREYQLAEFELISNPETGSLDEVQPLVYKNSLYFVFKNSTNSYLAKYDGNQITLISNPAEILRIEKDLFLWNDELYIKCLNSNNKNQLGRYDGQKITLFSNIRDNDDGFSGMPIIFKNKLYFRYTVLGYVRHLAKIEGDTITLIPNLDKGGGYIGDPIEYNNALYIYYLDANDQSKLVKYQDIQNNVSNDLMNPFFIYPNPVSRELIFNSDNHTIKNIRISDINGKILLKKNLSSNKVAVDFLSPGTYILYVDNHTYKFIKN